MITPEDIRGQVRRAIPHDQHSYNLDAVVAEVINEHGLVDLESVAPQALEAILMRHELPAADAADPFGSRWPGRDGRPRR